ncbi:hypothetical protein AB0533_003145 [Vibrio parahaemolyticus]|uniref:hypothetical protein n=1 Tax=Vibrio parahaemolyticus TaxID=670 RepID=UPI001E4ADC4F|nr:hypothetical protein [Vibrio parahaemolyticus]EGR2288207.1 hypothetical protein [Vibrio parahaemolyticus]ELB2044164.1 hypothetical protein [Vibrio parahaemolyticus]ELB2072786.1 hypothetical protein [Vibrio parahaemolyticus]MDG2590685.1 hypothetical protein [Vibrio parahaemolyticus]
MNRNKYLLLILNLFMLVGCGISQPVESPKNYVIVADSPAKVYPKKYEIVLIDSVRVESPFNDTQMVLRLSDVSFESDYYNRYITEPGAIIENQLPTSLTRSGVVGSTVPYNAGVTTNLVLKTVVTKLFGDFRRNQTPTAIMEIQFILVDSSSVRPTIIFDKKIMSKVELSEKTSEELAKGLGIALTEIFNELAEEVSHR